MNLEEIESFCPTDQQEWRDWLANNHNKQQSVWLVLYKAKSGKLNLSWSDAVDEALCFGWIDSIRKPIDEEKFVQFFSKRKPNSNWSRINKQKIERLFAEGKMTAAGINSIEIAKENGSWTILDDIEDLVIPHDLETELASHSVANEFFQGLSKSIKKQILYWLASAKREETRNKRLQTIISETSQRKIPNGFR